MFKLECADVKVNPSNRNYTQYIEKFRKKLDREYIFEVVCDCSFKPIDDPDMAHKIVAWLLIGDEWKRPINQKTASVVFFAMCNNIQKNRNVIITNIQQAYTLYNETENDFTKLKTVENTKDHPRFEKFDASFPFFLEGFSAHFKIPVRFVSVKNKKVLRMLDMLTIPEFVFEDGSTSQISWATFRDFFTGNKFPPGRLGVYDGEKISSMFNYDLRTMVDVMNHVGFHVNRDINLNELLKEYRYIIESNKLILTHSRIDKKEVEEMDSPYFKGNVLQPNKDYFIIITQSDAKFYTM